jgi:PST family polysaccharide transporter
MIKKIKNLANTDEKKRLFKNIISLTILQGANYLLQLITIPYLVRVLGSEYFGLLAFSTATIMYFNILTDYGFNYTATREISINRENKEKVIEIFSSVMIIKVILMILSFLLLCIIVFSFDKFSKEWLLYFLTFGTVVGQVFFPIWFFQGMEQMKYITYLNIISKLIFSIAIFVFVKEKSNYYLVPIFTSLGFIVAAICSLIIIKTKFNIIFKFQKIKIIKKHLNDGWHIFISNVYTLAYTTSIPFLLGIFTNNATVGYYSIADNITKTIMNLYQPMSQAIFPYINKLIITSEKRAKQMIFKIMKISVLGMLFFSIILFIFASQAIYLISGKEIKQAIAVLKILSILPVIITLARILSFNYIISFGLQRKLSRIYFITSLIGLPILLISIPLYKEIGASISIIFIEVLATFMMYQCVKKEIKFL